MYQGNPISNLKRLVDKVVDNKQYNATDAEKAALFALYTITRKVDNIERMMREDRDGKKDKTL